MLLGLLLAAGAGAEDIDEVFAVSPGGKLTVDLASGTIDIDTHDDASVEIDARGSMEQWTSRSNEDGDDVHVRTTGRSSFPFFSLGRAPPRARAGTLRRRCATAGGHIDIEELIGEIVAHTSGGSVEVKKIEGDVEASTSGGSIRATEVQGNVELETSGGSIRGSEISGSIEARTTGGSIRLREVGGPVEARTTGGSVDVRFSGVAEATSRRRAAASRSSSRPTRAWTSRRARPGVASRSIATSTSMATSPRTRIDAELNGGGPSLELRTMGGNVIIRAR